MRFIWAILTLLLISSASIAQQEKNKAEPTTNTLQEEQTRSKKENQEAVKDIPAPSRSLNRSAYYNQEAKQWEAAIGASVNNAGAWLNYYKAERFASFSDNNKEPSTAKKEELDEILNAMEQHVSGTFEYHFAKWLDADYATSGLADLERAYQLRPGSDEVLDDMVALYELKGETSNRDKFIKKLHRSNVIPSGVMEYNYNVLQSLEQGAVIITNGEFDTYPIWIQQEVYGVRTDVTVINLDLMKNDNYRARKLRKAGLTGPGSISSVNQFAIKLAKNNSNKPIYFGLTMRPYVIKTLKDDLYCTGLAMKYSKTELNNMDLLEANWEQKFKSSELQSGRGSSVVHKMNNNYLLPILQLKEWYEQNNKTEDARKMEQLALKIAGKGGKTRQVNKHLKK